MTDVLSFTSVVTGTLPVCVPVRGEGEAWGDDRSPAVYVGGELRPSLSLKGRVRPGPRTHL